MPRLSRTDAAILGMLTIEPMSGYDMKKFSERSLVHFWHESYGNLYPRLKRLEEAGLVDSRRERRDRAPDATVYSLNPTGQETFLRWMRKDPVRERVRNEFVLKLFFGSHVDLGLHAERFREEQRRQEALLDRYGEIEAMLRQGFDERQEVPFWLMALRRGQLLTEARLRWCEECAERIEAMTREETS